MFICVFLAASVEKDVTRDAQLVAISEVILDLITTVSTLSEISHI